jgi:hypothetical protein
MLHNVFLSSPMLGQNMLERVIGSSTLEKSHSTMDSLHKVYQGLAFLHFHKWELSSQKSYKDCSGERDI